jgi:hypothetical protein
MFSYRWTSNPIIGIFGHALDDLLCLGEGSAAAKDNLCIPGLASRANGTNGVSYQNAFLDNVWR